MTKKGYCELVLILDESGSMSSLKETLKAKVKEFVESQKKGEASITICRFSYSSNIKFDCEALPLDQFKEFGYEPSGSTALLDAIGTTINRVGSRLAQMKEEDRPEKVYVAIFTDGEENDSKEYTKEQIQTMTKEQESKYSWKIEYLLAGVKKEYIKGLTHASLSSMHAGGRGVGDVSYMFAASASSAARYRGI